MNSFRTRLTVLVAGVALLAVVLTAWGVAAATRDSVLDSFEERNIAEIEIAEDLTLLALENPDWELASEEIADMAADYNARIVLTDDIGRILVDTDPAPDLPPFTGIIDPFTAIAPFDDEVLTDDFELEVALCLEESGISTEFDEFGGLVIGEGDDELIEACFTEVLAAFTDTQQLATFEPAWLFVEFGLSPPVPWSLLLVIAGVVLLLSVGAAAFATGVISGPIRRLTDATRAIRRGDLSTRVDATATGEIGELTDSFNEMAAEMERDDERRRQLTSDVAHELRSPVTNIISHVDAFEDGVVEANSENLGIVLSEAQRLHHLIEDLGQLAQADEGQINLEIGEHDVAEVVSGAVEARRATETSMDLSAEPALAAVDPNRIGQIVGNLLDNAMSAAGENGHVEVSVADLGDTVEVSIRDDGPGISDELLPVIFDRFRRSDQARTPGTSSRGLGLSIAQALARAHGGEVRAANNEEVGAVFTLTLPKQPITED